MRELAELAQVLQHEALFQSLSIAAKPMFRSVLGLKRRRCCASGMHAGGDGVVHAAHHITQIDAHHSRLTGQQYTVAGQLWHHIQAAFRNHMTRMLNDLAAPYQRGDCRVLLEVFQHLVDWGLGIEQVGDCRHQAQRYRVTVGVHEAAANMAVGGVADEQPGSALAIGG